MIKNLLITNNSLYNNYIKRIVNSNNFKIDYIDLTKDYYNIEEIEINKFNNIFLLDIQDINIFKKINIINFKFNKNIFFLNYFIDKNSLLNNILNQEKFYNINFIHTNKEQFKKEFINILNFINNMPFYLVNKKDFYIIEIKINDIIIKDNLTNTNIKKNNPKQSEKIYFESLHENIWKNSLKNGIINFKLLFDSKDYLIDYE